MRAVRILVIGGTGFVGRWFVAGALEAGHDLTLFNRGITNRGLFPEAEWVLGDRDGGLEALGDRAWDAVVDVCGYVPRVVRDAARTLRDRVGRYLFVSTESVYAAPYPPLIDEESRLATTDRPTTEVVDGDTYGPLKVLCERAVFEEMGEEPTLVVRPGYVVGPHDPTGRFTSWARRVAQGGGVLAPAGYTMQFIDARDLGAFMLRLLEQEALGAFNGDGRPVPMGEVLAAAAKVAGSEPDLVWADEPWLLEHVEDATEAFPMWEPGPDGQAEIDVSKGIAHGLVHRSLEETVRDTLAWDLERGEAQPLGTGLTREREAELIAAWRAR